MLIGQVLAIGGWEVDWIAEMPSVWLVIGFASWASLGWKICVEADMWFLSWNQKNKQTKNFYFLSEFSLPIETFLSF